MKIGRPFRVLTPAEYAHVIANPERYTDFNTLGLYRSLLENEKLSLEEKLRVRELAHKKFEKTFHFLQLKDPYTYFQVSTLGENMTAGDEQKIWENIRISQEKILKDKRIRHRNFGIYSKHMCGYAHCPYNGVMFRQGSWFEYAKMHFASGNGSPSYKKHKATQVKKLRKSPIDTNE